MGVGEYAGEVSFETEALERVSIDAVNVDWWEGGQMEGSSSEDARIVEQGKSCQEGGKGRGTNDADAIVCSMER